jgi:hypothetical protein
VTKYLIAALMLFMFAGITSAQVPHVVPDGTEVTFQFKTGNDLLRMCQGSPFEKASCLAYIVGTVDLIGALQASDSSIDNKSYWKYKTICLPSGAEAGQIRDVVVKHLVEKPEERDHRAAQLIIITLIATWGCPAK